MAISIKHPFVSLKGDGGDATLVRPSNWNAEHATSISANMLVGRLSAGAGAFEEIPISAYMASILGTASKAALVDLLGLNVTGDVKYSYASTAQSGWMAANSATGTIGRTGSGGTLRANDDALALWTLIYNTVPDLYAPVSGGRTGNAVNDFNTFKIMTLRITGRVPVGAGNGMSGISSRDIGTLIGEENHLLDASEMPSHQHLNTFNDAFHSHDPYGVVIGDALSGSAAGAGPFLAIRLNAGNNNLGLAFPTTSKLTGASITNAFAGGSAAHNNLQPSIALTAYIKL